MRRTPGITVVAGLTVVALAAAGLWTLAPLPEGPATRGVAGQASERSRIIDPAGFIPVVDHPRFDEYLGHIRRESGIDLWIVLDSVPPGATLESAALEQVDRLGVGRETAARTGLLLYFDTGAERLKVEVGYGLEAHLPDAYLAFLVERHAPLLFKAADRSDNLRHLLRLLQARLRDAALGGEFDPAPLRRAALDHLSGGAGTNSDLKDTRRAELPAAPASSPDLAAGRTPQDTYASYLALLAAPDWHPDADLFTEESRQYLRGFPLTRAYRDFILLGESGKAWQLETRGDYALLVFTGTPLVSPHFFVRQGGVWRLDLMAEVRNTRERVGGPLTWSYEGVDDIYTRTFADLIIEVQGYRRLATGDNRALPVAGRPGG